MDLGSAKIGPGGPRRGLVRAQSPGIGADVAVRLVSGAEKAVEHCIGEKEASR